MKNLFNSATPEEKLHVLTNELKVPIDIIRGYAALIKKDIESNRVEPEKLLNMINTIAETADKIKDLRDEFVKS